MLASWVYKNEPTMTSGCSGCGAGRDCALRPLPAAADRTTGRCLASAAGGTYSSESSSAGAPVGAARRFEGGRAAAAAAAFSATTAVIVMVTGTTGSMAGAAAASQAASFALTGATTSCWNCGPIWVQACARTVNEREARGVNPVAEIPLSLPLDVLVCGRERTKAAQAQTEFATLRGERRRARPADRHPTPAPQYRASTSASTHRWRENSRASLLCAVGRYEGARHCLRVSGTQQFGRAQAQRSRSAGSPSKLSQTHYLCRNCCQTLRRPTGYIVPA